MNDTAFANGHAGNKGGAVSLSGGDDSWTVEFHRCSVENSDVGFAFKDDQQGEGGAFSVGERVTLLLSDCLVKNNSCGNKVRVVVYGRGRWQRMKTIIILTGMVALLVLTVFAACG